MSGDEVVIALAAGAGALAYWGGWLAHAAATNRLARPGRRVAAVAGSLVASLVIVVVALVTAADPQVQSSAGYILLFLAVAAATLMVVTEVGTILGLAALDGFVRGRNRATGWAVGGLWLGTGFVNAGANIGRGDTIYTTLGPLGLGLGTLIVLTVILAVATGGFRAVRLDRNTPAGVRFAGLFVAWGLILGRAVAGDWQSTQKTLEDFSRSAAAAGYILMGAACVEVALRPTIQRPQTRSWPWMIGPAACYVVAAVAWALS